MWKLSRRMSAGWDLTGRTACTTPPIILSSFIRMRCSSSKRERPMYATCADEIREYRGTLTEPGKKSPYRNRSVEENLDLFKRMRKGEFPDGPDAAGKDRYGSPNINMRDPVIYRIMHADHHRTGDKWCIYPMYDYAHCLSDSSKASPTRSAHWSLRITAPYMTGSSMSWSYHPQQIEFARLNLTYTVMSKRKLLKLVEEGYVTAGMTRVCRLFPVCAAGAIRRSYPEFPGQDRGCQSRQHRGYGTAGAFPTGGPEQRAHACHGGA